MKEKLFKFVFGAGIIVSGLLFGALPALASGPTVVSAKVTGPNTIVIVYSEAVTTTLADYSNFTGNLSGHTATALSGSGTNTITLTIGGGALGTSSSGTIFVATTTVGVPDNAPFTGGNISVADAQAPLFSSVSIGTSTNATTGTLANTGDTVTLTFYVSESIISSTVTIANQTVYANGTGSGPYTASYTLSGNDASKVIPFTLTATDTSGNQTNLVRGSASFNGQAITPVSNPAVISSPVVPAIYESNPVPVPAPSATPSYGFTSNVAGTITYGGDCASSTTAASVGLNTIVFNSLSAGLHNNCTIKVTDASGNTSNTIYVAAIQIGASSAPAVPASNNSSSSAGDGFVFTKQLLIGMTNNDVLELQKRLTVEGVYKGPITGKFGAQTLAGVQAYQKAHGLNPNGVVGPGTRAALNGK